MKHSAAVAALLPVFLAEAAAGGESLSLRQHDAPCLIAVASARECEERFDFQRGTPTDFLHFLRSAESPFPVFRSHGNWVRTSDIPALLEQTESTEACALVVQAHLSFAPLTRSTVGQQAWFLLQGLRKGEYPPAPYAKPIDEEERRSLVKWARRQMHQTDPRR
jgi:hypothetical protein